MAAIGRGPLLFRSWTCELGYINFQSWGTSAPLLYPASFIVRPPFYVPRIVPVGSVSLLTWADSLKVNLQGQDKFFGANGQSPPNLDWPVPSGYVPSVDLRTWVQPTDIQQIGKDQFFGLAGNPNFDWPVPRGYIPVIDLRSHVDQLKLNLKSQDTFFYGAGQAPSYDWPNPRGYPYPHWLVSWSDAIKLNTLVAAAPFANSNQPNPVLLPYNYDLRTWINPFNQVALETQSAESTLRPIVTTRYYPLDHYLITRGFINQSNLSLAITVTPFRSQDYQNPIIRVPGVDVRGWLQNTPVNLIHHDNVFGLGGIPNFDWPNPRGYTPSVDLKTWIDPLKINLRSQDTFFSGPGNGPDYDWPNPRGYVPAIDLKTWVWPLNLSLKSKDTFFGANGQAPANLDWTVPKGQVPWIGLKTWTNNTNTSLGQQPLPSFNYDWPNPRSPISVVDLKTWLQSTDLQQIGKDQFFGAPGQAPANLDWPNPRGPTHNTDLRTWISTNIQTSAALFRPVGITKIWALDPNLVTRGFVNQSNFSLGTAAVPFTPIDLPNPTGALPNYARTWYWNNLALEVGPLVPINFDWQNPYLSVPAVDTHRIFDTSTNILLNPAVAPSPFYNFDWQNPNGYTQAIDLKTQVDGFSLPLLGQDKLFGGAGQPLANLDWPVPKGPVPGIDLKTWFNVFNININVVESSVALLFGYTDNQVYFSANPSIAVRSQADVFQNNRSLYTPITVPFFNYDYPNTRGPVPVIDLRTWLQSTDLQQIGKDQFFGAPGQAPSNLDWPNPRGPASVIDRWNFVSNFNDLIQPTFKPFNVSDWPVPSGPIHNYFLKTWTNILNPNLSDKFFGGAGQVPANLDWPNPKGPPYPSWLQTWTDVYKLNLQDTFFGAAGQPPANLDWPVPKGAPPRAVDILGFIQPLNIAIQPLPPAPVKNYDFPNPVIATPPAIEEKVFYRSIITEFGNFAPFVHLDWPNPVRAAPAAVTMLTWLDQTKINLIGKDQFFGAGAPIYDYPNPRGYVPVIDLKTWVDTLKLPLRGKDKFFGGAGQVPANLDWPVPKGYVPLIDLKTITQSTNLSLLNPKVFFGPFFNYDWPNPYLKVIPAALQQVTAPVLFELVSLPIPPAGGGHRKKRHGAPVQPIWDRPQPKTKVELPPFAGKKASLPPAFVVGAKKQKLWAAPLPLDVGYANPVKIEQKIRESQQDMEDIKALLPIIASHLANNNGG